MKARNFSILTDFMKVYQFMTEIYEKDWRNGVPAPFLEYALVSSWLDKSMIHRWKIWEDGDCIVGFVFYEHPMSQTYFSLRPGYEELADEMVAYAEANMPTDKDKHTFVILGGQSAIEKAAAKAGYGTGFGYMEKVFDFQKVLDHPLPKGFHFVKPEDITLSKIAECCWKGFNHEEKEGPWNGEYESMYLMLTAPHMHIEDAVIIANEKEEYVCYSGMWWTKENHLAYMEPLCTIPEYRKRGLAAAALSEHYRRLKPKGATHMTGGENAFYEHLGFEDTIHWTYWGKN